MKKNITAFKRLKDSKNVSYYWDIDTALNRIKEGSSKELVDSIRKETDKEKRNYLKSKSICVLFSGNFTTRSDKDLKQHSGFVILDFDDVDNLEEFKDELKNDNYIYSCWISPSGNGIKALVKIPPCDKDEHKLYYEELEKHFNSASFDTSNKNVSRVCYESYDPNIYINKDSLLWDKKAVIEGYSKINRVPVIAMNNESKIIDNLFKWWQSKYNFISDGRNNNTFRLAAAFNEYGVSKFEALSFILSVFPTDAKDFTEREVKQAVQSAYSDVAAFNTKYFEDSDEIKNIKTKLSKGVSREEIKKDLQKRIPEETAEVVLDEIKEGISVFWSVKETKTGKKITVNNFDFKTFLEANGFFKYYAEKSEVPIFVRVISNIVSNSSVEKIKDFVLNYIEDLKLYDVWDHLSGSLSYFRDSYLMMLDSIDLKMLEDTKNNSYLYFDNGVVDVTGKDVNLIDYIDVGGYIWQNQIINRNFDKSENIDNDFKDLVCKVSDNDKGRINSLESTLGYLMHSFKDKTDQKAVILNDQEISDSEDPNGGSGKSLMLTALSYFKKVVKIDGKAFDPNRSDFVYQRVDLDTQILAFDDVKKNFNFESLFSLITEGITVNKKNKAEIFIPFDRSPKVIITTNYVINGSGNSHDRRRHEIEFNQYFNGKRTPLTEYGKLLFDQWSNEEWISFDNYMINCLQKFLVNGLTEVIGINADTKRFISSTSKDFYDWIQDGNLNANIKYYHSEKLEEFKQEFKDQNNEVNGRLFASWCKKYCDFKGYDYKKGKDNRRWFRLIDLDTLIEDEETDNPF